MLTQSIEQTIKQPNRIIESDMKSHIEDDLNTVNKIVDGKLVPCRWEDLSRDEQRAARAVMFDVRCEGDWY